MWYGYIIGNLINYLKTVGPRVSVLCFTPFFALNFPLIKLCERFFFSFRNSSELSEKCIYLIHEPEEKLTYYIYRIFIFLVQQQTLLPTKYIMTFCAPTNILFLCVCIHEKEKIRIGPLKGNYYQL